MNPILHTGSVGVAEITPVKPTSPRRKSGKRQSLGRLPDGWRESIFKAIQSPRLKDAVAVLTATGCRPSEIERGVLVRLKDGLLGIGIEGTKVNEAMGRGQVRRVVTIADNTPWGAYLLGRVTPEPSQSVRIFYDAEGVSQRLREKSRELWPRRKSLVSGYSYRHFIGKAMKEAGLDKDLIAKTLGHATDFAQCAYGRAGGSRKAAGDHGILDARTTNPIRHSPKTHQLERFLRSRIADFDINPHEQE